MRSTSERGFTFVELLLVLSIMGVVAAIAVPQFSGLIQNYKLTNAARAVWLDLHRARMRAIKERRAIRVDFTATSYTMYRVRVAPEPQDTPIFSRNLAGAYSGTTFDTGYLASVSFGSTGTANSKTVVIRQSPTRRKNFTISSTGRIRQICPGLQEPNSVGVCS